MTTLSLALESLSDPVTEQAVQYEFSVDEELYKLDNHFSLVTECYSVIDSIKKQEFISFEDYSGIKDWVYTKSAQLNIPVKLKIATETIASCQSLALEGIGDFFSAIWTAIKKIVAGIWEFLKRVFGASKKNSENTSRNLRRMEDEIRALMSKQKHFDHEKIKAYIDSAVSESKLDDFKHVVLSDIAPGNSVANSVSHHINVTLSQIKSITDVLSDSIALANARTSYIGKLVADVPALTAKMSTLKLHETDDFINYRETVKQYSASLPSRFINGFYSDKQDKLKPDVALSDQRLDLSKAKFLLFKVPGNKNTLKVFCISTLKISDDRTSTFKEDVFLLSDTDVTVKDMKEFTTNSKPDVLIPPIDDVGYLIINAAKFVRDADIYAKDAESKVNNKLISLQANIEDIHGAFSGLDSGDAQNETLKENINTIRFLLMDSLSENNITASVLLVKDRYMKIINDYLKIIQDAYTEGLK